MTLLRTLYLRKTSTRSLYLRGCAVASAVFLTGCGLDSMTIPRFPSSPDDTRITNEQGGTRLLNETSRVAQDANAAPPPPPPAQSQSAPPPQPRNIPQAQPNNSGLNPKNLFGESLRSEEERIDRLERAMQDLRNDFDSVRPAIRRLMAVESDMQSLLTELRKLNNNPAAFNRAPQRQAAPAPRRAQARSTPKRPLQTKTPPPVTNGMATIFDVRVGDHSNKTRLVLDSNAKAGFTVDIDNNERIMIVELSNAKWGTANSGNLRSKLLKSYRVENSGDNPLVVFQLSRSAQILSQSEIGGANGTGRRIVIDLR